MKTVILLALMSASSFASDWTWVDFTVKKDGLEYCKSETKDFAYRIVLKDQNDDFLDVNDMFVSVWDRTTDQVEKYFYVREVFQGRAYRNSKNEEVQATSPNHVGVTNFKFITASGAAGMKDESPYLPWRDSCGTYVKN